MSSPFSIDFLSEFRDSSTFSTVSSLFISLTSDSLTLEAFFFTTFGGVSVWTDVSFWDWAIPSRAAFEIKSQKSEIAFVESSLPGIG